MLWVPIVRTSCIVAPGDSLQALQRKKVFMHCIYGHEGAGRSPDWVGVTLAISAAASSLCRLYMQVAAMLQPLALAL